MTIAAAFGILALTESGVPIPVPGDLVMLFVGERASAGQPSLLVAMLALELITLVATTALFVAARGPARAAIAKLGPRIGLTEERMARLGNLVEKKSALAIGRMTPGTRTVTVVVAATAPSPWRSTLPPLLIGSTIFVQGHVLLGYALGPLAREALEAARGPMLIVLGVLVLAAIAVWIKRRRGRGAAQAFSEAACPACLAVSGLGYLRR